MGTAALAAEGAGDGRPVGIFGLLDSPRRGVQEAPSEPFWAVHLGERKEERIKLLKGVSSRENKLLLSQGQKMRPQIEVRPQMSQSRRVSSESN